MPAPVGEQYGEPWRYQCPDCESHAITELIGGQRVRGKTYRRDGIGQQQAREDSGKQFRCRVCGERKGVVWDKKTESEVRNVG